MKQLFFLVFFSCSFCMVSGQVEDSIVLRNVSNTILTKGIAYDNLRYLCKKIGPRLSGSENAQKAVVATMQMLKEAGADTVYLQPCMVPHWIRGNQEKGIIRWNGNNRNLHVCALGGSVATPEKGLQAPVIEVTSFDNLKKMSKEDIRGKIIFFNYPMQPQLIFDGYGDAVDYRLFAATEAAKMEAAGVLIRSVTHALDDYPHTGVLLYEDTVVKIPAMACSTKDAEWLSALLKKEKNATMYMHMDCKQLPDVKSYNVIGEIRGSEKPEEIITCGGHLDSWDLGEGAHDDGAGIVQSIEVIRAITSLGLTPKRTIRAVMFMNEENGGGGAKKYAELAVQQKEHHVFAIESDEGGFGCAALDLDGKEEQKTKIKHWLPLLSYYGIFTIADGGPGQDIKPLKETGAMLCNVSPLSQRYFDYHHSQADVFENVNKRELELGAIGMAAIVWMISKYGL